MTHAPPAPSRARTHGLTALLIALIPVLLLYAPTYLSMAAVWWRSDTFAHGLLVVPISAYLAWRCRHTLAHVSIEANFRLLLPLALASAIWLLARLAEVSVVQQFAAVSIVVLLIWTAIGTARARLLLFPLAFLFFAVPAGEGLVPPLMEITAWITLKLLQLSAIPVYREGFFLSIPSGDFEVAKACSGIRYLIASIMLGTLFAYLTYHSWRRRLAFIALSALVPVLANGVRAYGIVVLAHVSNMRIAVGVDHLLYGWLFFGLVMALLFWLGLRFQDTMPTASTAPAMPTVARSASMPARLTLLVAALSIAAAAPITVHWLERRNAAHSVVFTPVLPDLSWQSAKTETTRWRPLYRHARVVWRDFQRQGQPVRVAMAYYPPDRRGELINMQNSVYDPAQWSFLGQRHVTVTLADGRIAQVVETNLKGREGERLVWHWYVTTTYTGSASVRVKIAETWAKLRQDERGSALLAVSTPYAFDQAPARALLTDSIRQLYPVLQRCWKADTAARNPCVMSAPRESSPGYAP